VVDATLLHCAGMFPDFRLRAKPPGLLRSRFLMTVASVFGDSVRLYRLMFRRSVATAAIVYVAVAALGQVPAPGGNLVDFLWIVMLLALGLATPMLIQGALVAVVQSVHEGRPPPRIRALLRRGGTRFWPLLGGALLYGIGVGYGLILFIVPGLLVACLGTLVLDSAARDDRALFCRAGAYSFLLACERGEGDQDGSDRGWGHASGH